MEENEEFSETRGHANDDQSPAFVTHEDKFLAQGEENELTVRELKVDIEIETDDIEQGGPDGGWGWFIVLGSVITMAITGGMERSAGVLFLRFDEKFKRSAAMTAWVTSLSTVVDMMSGPISSSLSNRFSARMIVITGSLLSAISVLVSGFTPNLEFLFFSYGILSGFGRSCMCVPAMVLVGLYFNKRRGLAVGLSTAGIGLGAFMIPPLVEFFFSYYGFTGAFIMLTGVVLQVTVCGALYRSLNVQIRLMKHDRKRIEKKREETYSLVSKNNSCHFSKGPLETYDETDNGLNIDASTYKKVKLKRSETAESTISKIVNFLRNTKFTSTKSNTKIFEFSLLKNFRFLMVCVAIMLFYLAFLTTNVFIPAYSKAQGLTDFQAASQLSFTGMLGTISRVTTGFVFDLEKVKPHRMAIYNSLMYLTATSCLVIPRLKSFVQLSVSSAIYGVFTGSFLSQNSLVVIDVLGLDKLTSSYGIIMCFQGIGALCGPSIAGLLKDTFGTFDTAFYFAGSSVLFGAILLSMTNIIHQCKHAKL